MGFFSRLFGGSGGCGFCGRHAFTTAEFEAECSKAGFIKDAATGRFKMKVGGLAGSAEHVSSELARQEGSQQKSFDQIEGHRGYECKACGKVYCMDCLFAKAPPHPDGGKACPKCGSTFKHHE